MRFRPHGRNGLTPEQWLRVFAALDADPDIDKRALSRRFGSSWTTIKPRWEQHKVERANLKKE